MILAVLSVFSCKKNGNGQQPEPKSTSKVHPVSFEAFADGMKIGYATLNYTGTTLSDIRFFDTGDKLILIMMPDFNEQLTKVNWTLLSRSFNAIYEYEGIDPAKVTFNGDSDFSIVRFLDTNGKPPRRTVVVTTSNNDNMGSTPLPTLDIEYEYIATERRTAAAIFKVDNYDDPAGYLIYHYSAHGNLASIDYRHPLLEKHKDYQMKLKYSGNGSVDQDAMQLIDRVLFLPAPVIFEWILD